MICGIRNMVTADVTLHATRKLSDALEARTIRVSNILSCLISVTEGTPSRTASALEALMDNKLTRG
jgi:hypothetical protein